jgi:tetratricopeptide (TPR) repeat protein
MRRLLPSLIVLGLALSGSPAGAADEWKELYLDARDKDLKGDRPRYEDAIRHLTRALASKPSSSLGERSYSLEFFDYFPHYQLGRAYMGLQRRDDAIASFREELRQGLIQKIQADHQNLNRLLKEAEDRQSQEIIRGLRAQFDQLMLQVSDLERADRIEAAMGKAQEAMAHARNLDANAQTRVTSVLEGLRQKQAAKETEARLQREREALQRELSEARRLLGAGQHRDALVKFDALLRAEPGNAQAREGRAEAGERLLATTTREKRVKDLADGKALLEAGAVDAAIPPLTEAATDPTLTEAIALLKRAQDLSAQRRARTDSDRRIGELRREVLGLMDRGNYPEASLRLNRILGLAPGDPEATQKLADIDERMARNTRDLLLGDRELPALAFVAPKQAQSETYEDSITVSGVATDDRGLARITIRSGDVVTQSQDLSKVPEGRTHTFDVSVPVKKGVNRVVVSVLDRKGRSFEAVFEVDRRPTLVEHPYFYPLVALCAVSLVGTGAGVYAARRRRALRNRFNPYIAGAPVLSNAMFFGRKKLLNRVLNMIHANSLMITGDRRIGKTSFMHHLKMALADDEGTEFKFFPVAVDLQGVPEKTFFHTMMSEIVDALGPSPEALAVLRFRLDNDDYDDRDFSRDLQRVITELKTRTPKKVKLALLLDEVDELNEYSERVNQRLRSVFMKTFSENLVAVMSGVGIRRSWKSEGSPWYNFFDEFELSGLSRDEAEELIRTPVQGVFRFEDEAVERILNASDLKPYLIQKFCIHAVNHMIEDERSTIAVRDVAAVEALVLSDESVAPRETPDAADQPNL